MKTKLLATFKKEKDFNLQEFLPRFEAEAKREGINIDDLENYNKEFIAQSDDFIEYTFSTDYVFYPVNTFENVRTEKIYDKLERFKEQFNNENKTKIRAIVVLREPK